MQISHISKSLGKEGKAKKWEAYLEFLSKPRGFRSFSLHVYGFALTIRMLGGRGLASRTGVTSIRSVTSYKISWSCTIAILRSSTPTKTRSRGKRTRKLFDIYRRKKLPLPLRRAKTLIGLATAAKQRSPTVHWYRFRMLQVNYIAVARSSFPFQLTISDL